MTAEAADSMGRESRPGAQDVVSLWASTRATSLPRLSGVKLRHARVGGISLRHWAIAIVLVSIAVVDMARGYSLVMSSVNTMQHSGQGPTLRLVVDSHASQVHAKK
jgi:hypothetical protein